MQSAGEVVSQFLRHTHKLALEELFVVCKRSFIKTRQSDLFVRAPLLSNADWLSTIVPADSIECEAGFVSVNVVSFLIGGDAGVSWRVWGTAHQLYLCNG